MAGHLGYEITMQRAKRDFFWRGMKNNLKQFIRECEIYQKHKQENTSSGGLLQSLPIPLQIWSNISMDFVEGLPFLNG